jgi:FkbH-like protein
MVTVIELPPQPERYSEVLLQEGLFDTLGLTDEDRRRGELYRQRAEAEALRASIGSVEDYYRDLQMELSLAPVDRISLPRAAQLTQKTNQFNATTRATARPTWSDARTTRIGSLRRSASATASATTASSAS